MAFGVPADVHDLSEELRPVRVHGIRISAEEFMTNGLALEDMQRLTPRIAAAVPIHFVNVSHSAYVAQYSLATQMADMHFPRAAFRYLPRYPSLDADGLASFRKRLERFGRVAPIRAFVSELREAEERSLRGEPAHLGEMIVRLARVAISQNTRVEERLADEKDRSVDELASLRADVEELVREHGDGLAQAVRERFAAAEFPFRHDRHLPRITVSASAGDLSLEPGFRSQHPWTKDAKRALIARGYEATDAELAKFRTI